MLIHTDTKIDYKNEKNKCYEMLFKIIQNVKKIIYQKFFEQLLYIRIYYNFSLKLLRASRYTSVLIITMCFAESCGITALGYFNSDC